MMVPPEVAACDWRRWPGGWRVSACPPSEPTPPPVVWSGEGRPPASNHACLHGLIYVLITGIGWEYVPPCSPCGRTIKARLDRWLQLDAFRVAWQGLAERYAELHGINWDKVLLDGSRK